MKGKSSHIATLKYKVFQIPIEEFELDMDTESSKEKKKEILELFTTDNKLRSKEEFDEIKKDLHFACSEGDLELIKILLSETIEDASNSLQFKIDETKQTASLFKVKINTDHLFIPQTVIHESTKYLITSIVHVKCRVETIKFAEDSAIKTFYRNAFYESNIEEIYFPASLKELKEGWCYETPNLRKIIISPSNGQYEFKENKYLICKSDENDDEFDTLLFVRRDINKFSIPSNIKIISSYAFYRSYIESIFIPSNVMMLKVLS